MSEQLKCGYCSWVLKSHQIGQHSCFDYNHYKEGAQLLVVDESKHIFIKDRSEYQLNLPEINNKENEGVTFSKSKLDEDLISAVQKRRALYDHRISLKERGRQKKDLWIEVSQYLKGLYTPAKAEKRWNYLKDCYRKARNTFKKLHNSEKRSGAASKSKSKESKSSFRYYNAMNFLSDILEYRQSVTSLRGTSPDILASTSTDIRDQSISVPLNNYSSDNVFGEFINNDVSENDRLHSTISISTSSSMSSETKKRKRFSTSEEYEKLLIETLKQDVQSCPIEGFMSSRRNA